MGLVGEWHDIVVAERRLVEKVRRQLVRLLLGGSSGSIAGWGRHLPGHSDIGSGRRAGVHQEHDRQHDDERAEGGADSLLVLAH